MKTEPNENAFAADYGGGLTKREYFAAMALQGLLAARIPFATAAIDAVKRADQLIAELNKEIK